jgi:hypothetical protein
MSHLQVLPRLEKTKSYGRVHPKLPAIISISFTLRCNVITFLLYEYNNKNSYLISFVTILFLILLQQ